MILVYIFLTIGLIFQTLGVIALYRFPDVYTRLHGTTKCTTLGSIFFYIGIIIYAVSTLNLGIMFSVHVIMLLLFVMLTSSTGAHAIARAAHRSGIMPRFSVVDKLKEKKIKKWKEDKKKMIK